jgi:hypothetical protein
MCEAAQQTKPQIYANLEALHRQLEEMTVKMKRPGNTEQDQRQEVRGPVMVFRGK